MTSSEEPRARHAAPPASNPVTLAAWAGLWLATLGNWPLWRALYALPEMQSPRGLFFMLSVAVMIAALVTALLSLLAWRRSVKPAIVVLLLSSAFGAHFMGSYGVVIDPTMMVNVLNTDVSEARDLLDLRLVLTLALLAGLPMALLWRTRVARARFVAQALTNAAALVVSLCLVVTVAVLGFADLSSTLRNHKSLRYMINPVNSIYALVRLAADASARPAGPPLIIGADAKVLPRTPGTRPPLLLLVVGETARSDHFSANGYARQTNADTATLGLASFRHVTSCGTNTAASLPCMFSHLGRDGFVAREQEHENLLDLLHRAGLAVLWLENQAGCKGVCLRVPHASTHDSAGSTRHAEGLCDGEDCLDEALLTGLDERLAALPEEKRSRGVVLVLHQMGSHGPAYFKRSPTQRKPFLPECRTNVLQQCSEAELINAFDNSITYTDHVLAQGIGWLARQEARYDPAMLYVSDHGESLGENGLYLHGMPYSIAPREQKHVPMLMWLAPQTEAALGVTMDCLRGQQDATLSHDHLFHTVMGLVGVSSREYRQGLDVLQPCRAS